MEDIVNDTSVELIELSDTEIEAKRPSEGNIEFRSRVSPETLEKIKKKAPELTMRMLSDPSVSIDFGQDVVQQINTLSSKLLKEQEKTNIPAADAIVNDILRSLDGYNAKYKKAKEPGAVAKFFKKLGAKGKEAAYDLKAMVREAKPIVDKLTEASGKIQRMELEIDENIVRSQQLRNVTIESLDDVAAVIAVFEEVLELATKEIIEASAVLEKAVADGSAVVEYHNKKYSVEEYREVLADLVASQGEIEKTWFNWRQKFFLYIVNVTSIREIINTSVGLKRTANRVRMSAIPAAETQLAAWQQAALVEESAKTVAAANRGMEELILGASRGQLSAIQNASEANQQQMLSERAIVELTENVQAQFAAIVEAEIAGREARAANLAILRESEEAILAASAEAQRELIARSVHQLSGSSPSSRVQKLPSSALTEEGKEVILEEVKANNGLKAILDS